MSDPFLNAAPQDGAEVPSARALPLGTRLRGEFDIISVLHEGAFGISYLAQDVAQQRQVVIREYMPAMLAERLALDSQQVEPRDIAHAGAFIDGLKSFGHEARQLVAFDNPGLVSMLRLWKQNGTAYMVLQRVEGATWRSVVADPVGMPDEAQLREWLAPLLEALKQLHAAHCVHGNITPDNIMIGPHGPVLLGFGGGRHAIGKATGDPSTALKPGWAAPEQYDPSPAEAPDPSTDLYALAAVIYWTLTGRVPLTALQRRAGIPLAPLRELVAGRFSASLTAAVDTALALQPSERPQDVPAFQAMLNGESERESEAGSSTASHGNANGSANVNGDGPQRNRISEPPFAPVGASMLNARPGASVAPAASTNRGITIAAVATALCTIAFGTLAVWALRPTDGLSLPPAAAADARFDLSQPSATAPIDMPPPSAGPSLASLPSLPPVTAAPSAAPAAPNFTTEAVIAPVSSLPPTTPPTPAPSPNKKHTHPTPSTPQTTAAAAHCSDLLRRASLDTLTRDQAATLKRECR